MSAAPAKRKRRSPVPGAPKARRKLPSVVKMNTRWLESSTPTRVTATVSPDESIGEAPRPEGADREGVAEPPSTEAAYERSAEVEHLHAPVVEIRHEDVASRSRSGTAGG